MIPRRQSLQCCPSETISSIPNLFAPHIPLNSSSIERKVISPFSAVSEEDLPPLVFEPKKIISHEGNTILLQNNGSSKIRIGEEYVDVCNCLSQVKHKQLGFKKESVIFTLSLTAGSSYMANIRTIVTEEGKRSEDAFYEGIATIRVDPTGDVTLNVPSEAVFTPGFSWRWKIGPNKVQFTFESSRDSKFQATGRLDILSDGDSTFVVE
jgi:hypothetical protein